MKTTTPPVLVALAALAVAFSPVLFGQTTSGPDQTQNARANDSTADQHASTTGAPSTQSSTIDKNDTKNPTSQTIDANPSNNVTPSDAAVQSTTKTPSDATTGSPVQGRPSDSSSSASSESRHEKPLTDKEFVTRAAQGGMTEVALGKVASEKGNASQVKDFGSMMVKDHSKANDELKDLAGKKGIVLAPNLDERNQAQVDRISKLSGPAFDKAYVKNQLSAHESTVKLFQQEAQSGQDADIKAFASRTLPTLQQHLSHVQGLENSGVK